jgi:outer membrane protein
MRGSLGGVKVRNKIKVVDSDTACMLIKNCLSKSVAAVAFLSIWSIAAQAQALKIGYVDGQRIVREANSWKAAQLKLKTDFGKREKELQGLDLQLRAAAKKFDKDRPTLSEAEHARRAREVTDSKRELDRKKREFQEDLNQRRGEEQAALTNRVNRAIRQIGEREKYDLVLQNNVARHSRNVDITKKVIDVLNASQ